MKNAGIGHLPQHGLQVDPHLDCRSLQSPRRRESSPPPALPAAASLSVPAPATPSNAETPKSACAAMNKGSGMAHPAVQEPAGRGTQPDSGENHREEQRVHRTEAADGVGDVSETRRSPCPWRRTRTTAGRARSGRTTAGLTFNSVPFDPRLRSMTTPLAAAAASASVSGQLVRCQVNSPGGGKRDCSPAAMTWEPPTPTPGMKRKSGEESPGRGSRGVDPVERPDPPSGDREVALNQVSNQQGERPPHQQGYRGPAAMKAMP